MENKTNKKYFILPFTDFKVNMYNYTCLNKLKETRLIKKVEDKKRAEENYKVKDSDEHVKELVKQ